MKSVVALMVCVLTLFAGDARAQSGPSSPGNGYVEFLAQSAFGNVTSQAFGGEAGMTVGYRLQIFVEGGRVRDVATSDLGAGAAAVAAYLTGTQGQANVAYQVKEPVNFGIAGVKYPITDALKVVPYVLGGAGIAKVTKNVQFTIGGTDVTNNLSQYFVVLGTDLQGTETKGMLSVGGGVMWPVWQRLMIDFQYRYGRIFLTGQGINVNRAGVGIGIGF
jgi:opacity protein-like surface antigen